MPDMGAQPAPSSVSPQIVEPITIDSTTSKSNSAPLVAPPVLETPAVDSKSGVDNGGEMAIYNGPVKDFGPAPAPISSAAGQTSVTAAPIVSPSLTLSGGSATVTSSIALPTVVSTTTASTTTSTDVVHGFAKAVPVTVALRQLLPPGYAFTIDKDVKSKTLISYNGGKPWRDTLQGALTPVGLVMHEQGQTVEISRAGSASSMAPVVDNTPYQPSPAPKVADNNVETPVPGVDTTVSSETKSVPPVIVAEPTSAPAAPFTDMTTADSWIADRGSSLHKVLEQWCRRAHVEFNWAAEYDYPLDASVNYQGSFTDAVRSLLTGFEAAHPQPIAELHNNPTLGQMVLVVTTRGNTNSD